MIPRARLLLRPLFSLLVLFSFSCAPAPSKDIASIQKEFKDKTGLDLRVDSMPPTSWKLDYHLETAPDLPKLGEYLRFFREEFGKYPGDFFGKTDLKTVVFVKDLG